MKPRNENKLDEEIENKIDQEETENTKYKIESLVSRTYKMKEAENVQEKMSNT